jgi:hypothetical protein
MLHVSSVVNGQKTGGTTASETGGPMPPGLRKVRAHPTFPFSVGGLRRDLCAIKRRFIMREKKKGKKNNSSEARSMEALEMVII